jgi:hypothetical protein
MLSIPGSHDDVGKYVISSQVWGSRTHAYELEYSIRFIIVKQFISESRKSSVHSLIADEDTDISCIKLWLYAQQILTIIWSLQIDNMLILTKLRPEYENDYLRRHLHFGSSQPLLYCLWPLFAVTSYGASLVLGKKNGEATALRRKIKHWRNSVSFVRRKSLNRRHSEAVARMYDIETLVGTVYAVFNRSFVKKEQPSEVVKITKWCIGTLIPDWTLKHTNAKLECLDPLMPKMNKCKVPVNK